MTGKRRADPGSGRGSGGSGRGRRGAGRDPVSTSPPAPTPPPLSFNAPPPPSMVIQPQASRREVRAQRKKEQRKKVGLGGGLLAAVIAIALIVTVVLGVHHAVTTTDSGKRTQTTLLFQLQGADRTASASMLLAHDPQAKQGVELMIQPRLISDVCGYGQQNFGDVLALPGGITASRQALSTALNNTTIDGSWVLSDKQFATLINTLGGLHLNVDDNVVVNHVVVVPAGPDVHVNGDQAVAYATFATDASEGAAAQLLRLQLVMDATIQALPKNLTGIEALLRPLGPNGSSTVGITKLATLLLGLNGDDQTQTGVYAADLPATTIDAGGSSPSYQPDASANGVTKLVSSYLKESAPSDPNAASQTVYLQNGTGLPGLVATACPKLTAHGFTYAGSGNATSFKNTHSQVQIFSDNDVAQGDALARALGLSTNDVVEGTLNQNVAKYVVILGKDYKG